MRRAALFIASFLLFSIVLYGGVRGAPAKALADGSTVITFADPDFFQALVYAGVDTNHDGSVTEDEMAVPTHLEISGDDINDLTGIGYAVNLTSLTISYTNITALPSEISSLTQLKTLKLDVNSQMSVSGLPSSLWTMTGLTTLDLDMDNITSIPVGIQSLNKLTELNLYGNNISTLPDFIGNLTSLQKLYLQSNDISVLPASICQLTKLEELTLWGNKLASLPDGIGSMAALTQLDLDDNRLISLPSSLGNLKALTKLVLSDNYFNPDAMPDGTPGFAVIQPQKTYAVSVDYMGGTGTSLPKSDYYYSESVTLPAATKAGCVFTGWDTDGDGEPDKKAGDTVLIEPSDLTVSSIVFTAIYGYKVTFSPQPFGTINSGTSDITLNVNAGEHVSGVPAASANPGYTFLGWYDGNEQVTEVQIVDMDIQTSKTFIAKFEAVGTIHFPDAEFANALAIAGADKNGDGFITAAEMQSLQELDLSGGKFTDITGIGQAATLQTLRLGPGKVSTLPDEITQLTALKVLDLGGNPISGLPATLSEMTGLEEVDMDGCGLTGFPTELEAMAGLKTLDLSSNLLTSLPDDCFNGMTGLESVNFSLNYFRPGQIFESAPAFLVTDAPQHDYSVSLNYNGGSGPALPEQHCCRGETVTLPNATKAGCVFMGWDTDGDGVPDKNSGDAAQIEPAVLTDASVVFHAVYGYTVNFATQKFGTINGDTTAFTVIAGKNIASVPDVSAGTGYDFLGWYIGSQKYDAADILGTAIQANMTFTAEYDAVGTITFADSNFAAALAKAGADINSDGFITSVEMQSMTELDLSGGMFTNIAGIKEAKSLQTLRLGSGQVTALPEEITQLTALKVLDLSGNPIASMPASLSGLANLEELDMVGCGLKLIPAQLQGLTGLKTLNLAGNLLTGFSGDCFAGMTGLAHLDLSGNYFNPNAMPSGTPTFAVKLPQKSYIVSLDFKGGKGTALPKSSYYYGETIALPAATGGVTDFYGWDANGDGVADIKGAGSTALTPNPPDSISSVKYSAVYLSSNAHLSGIVLSAGAYITPAKFDPLVAKYTVTLYDYVSSVTATPKMANANAKMLIKGSSAASVTLLPTSGDVVISLTAQDGTTKFSYTLHVVRAPHVDLGLSGIGLPAGITLSPAFSAAATSYTALVPAATGSVTVTAKRTSTASSVSIGGIACPTCSTPVSVAPGAVKIVQIVVSAPLSTDKTKIYTLTLKRGTSVSGFSAAPKVGTAFTFSPGGTNRMTLSYSIASAGSVKIEVYKSGKWIQILARSETSAGVKSWAWDGKVSGAFLPVAAYNVRITPTANGIVGAASTISVKIAKYPTVTWGPAVSSLKATGAVVPLCSFKVDVPTDASVQVYNSSGKLAATVKGFTNLLPSSAYTAVSWNGRATSGNTAGLAVNALVPAGTYTIRITVGTKVYSKSIKVTR